MLEMLAVLAVIAILALMAVPSFQDQILRDQIREGLPLADIAKRPVELSWAMAQALPPDNAAAGLPAPDKIVNKQIRSVELKDGAIHVTFGNRASTALAGKILSLRPAVVEDAPVVPVTWVCGYAEAPDKTTLKGDNRTSVSANFLPAACRSRAKT